MLRELIARYLHSADIEMVMRIVADVARYDRYQASVGIQNAAAVVAEYARAIGLDDVEIHQFAATGEVAWWSYSSPLSWTPERAELRVHQGDELLLAVDHQQTPFTVATYSAATPSGGLSARIASFEERGGMDALAGKVVLINQDIYKQGAFVDALIEMRAAGFITDGPCRLDIDGAESAGRIELAPRSPLFGFSITSAQFGRLRSTLSRGLTAWAHIAVDQTAQMPVVTATLPGDGSGDALWLTAHLCHPRPGANDNASGVAALLGVAQALRHSSPWKNRPTLHFIWGPEFLGVAATLHSLVGKNHSKGLPAAVINLDMVGEDQGKCRSPLVVERPAECIDSIWAPVAEAVADAVFVATSGTAGNWQASPFLGFSDHALFAGFADSRLRRPAIQICHVPDRFNHSAADGIDKVCSMEMRRAIALAATVIVLMGEAAQDSWAEVREIVDAWCWRELATKQQIAARFVGVEGAAWSQRLLEHAWKKSQRLRELCAARDFQPEMMASAHGKKDDQALVARWDGPFNTRGLLASLPRESRKKLATALAARKYHQAILVNLALCADGRRNRSAIIDTASLALGHPIDIALAVTLMDSLEESRWLIAERSQPTRRTGS